MTIFKTASEADSYMIDLYKQLDAAPKGSEEEKIIADKLTNFMLGASITPKAK